MDRGFKTVCHKFPPNILRGQEYPNEGNAISSNTNLYCQILFGCFTREHNAGFKHEPAFPDCTK